MLLRVLGRGSMLGEVSALIRCIALDVMGHDDRVVGLFESKTNRLY